MTPDDLRAAIAASEEIAGGPKRRLLGLPDGHLELLHDEWSKPDATSAKVMGAFYPGAISFDAVKDMRRVLQGTAVATQTGPRKAPTAGHERRNGHVDAPSGVEIAAELHGEPAPVMFGEEQDMKSRTMRGKMLVNVRISRAAPHYGARPRRG